MTNDHHLEAVIRQVREMLASQVTPNVKLVTYGGDVVQLAELPALVLYLPTLRRVRSEADNEPEHAVDVQTRAITTYQPAQYRDMVFRYELVADPITLTRLIEGMALLIGAGAVTVARPARNGGTESITYDLVESQEPTPVGGAGHAHRMAGQFTIKGVELRPSAGTTGTLVTRFTPEYESKEG